MGRSKWKLGAVAAVAAGLAMAASARADDAPVTKCTALDICYCVNTKYLAAIDANVTRVRKIIRDNKAAGEAVGYLSVPLSPAGGGSFEINSEAAAQIAGDVVKRFGPSVYLLNPGAEAGDGMNGGSGADFMYMWTQILEGGGNGEDFDFFYFAGPTDFSRYFLKPPKEAKDQPPQDRNQVDDYFGKLDDFFDKRMASDDAFRKAVEAKQITKPGFRIYYGLRASVAFSLGSHDEWNIARLLNARRRGVEAFGIPNQLSIFFDGQPVNPGNFESPASSGDTGRCVK
jgi:hypothetical protein